MNLNQNCEHIQGQLSALLDDELDHDVRASVELHLQGCADCARQWQALVALDRRLDRSVVLPDVNERVARMLESRNNSEPIRRVSGRGQRFRVTRRVLVGVTALAVAVVLLATRVMELTRANAAAGRVVQLTGSIELSDKPSDPWKAVSQAADLRNGVRLRTGQRVRCELETNRRSRIRVDEQAEVIVHSADRIELVAGQIWCAAAPGDTLTVEIPLQGTVEPLLCSMACPSSSEFQWSSRRNGATCEAGEHSRGVLNCGSQSIDVPPGSSVTVDAQLSVLKNDATNPAAKLWQLPLLADDRSELSLLLRPVLGLIGRSKAQYLTEQQIRELGAPGAMALLAFVEFSAPEPNDELRRFAMRIAVDTADTTALASMQRLATDQDPIIADDARRWLAEQ